MLRIAVCDDEQNYLHDIERLLREYGALRSIALRVTTFALPFDLAQSAQKDAEFDVYLLDIVMPGMTGVELAREIRKTCVEAPIIFLTTSRDYALEAYGVGAIGYLVKPFEREALYKALDGVINDLVSERRRFIPIKTDGALMRVAVRDILFCEASGNYKRVHLADGRDLSVRITMNELFTLLAPSGSFVRCGIAYLLNLAKIRKMSAKAVQMSDGTIIPIPRGANAELKAAYYAFYIEG